MSNTITRSSIVRCESCDAIRHPYIGLPRNTKDLKKEIEFVQAEFFGLLIPERSSSCEVCSGSSFLDNDLFYNEEMCDVLYLYECKLSAMKRW